MMKLQPILAALVLVAAGAASVFAQDADPSNFEILTDLRENNLSAEEILGVTAPGNVTVVGLEDFKGADLQRLEETLGNTEDGFGEVQTAIERNEAFEVFVRQGDLSLSDIVAVTRSVDGGVTLYTDLPRR